MKVHAVSTGTVAIHERQVEGSGPGPLRSINTLLDRHWTDPLPILVWVVEHPEGLIVADTGETARATEAGYFPRWHPFFRLCVREYVTEEEEAGPAIRRLGLDPADVRWVVMTHLHTDHAGGLAHFPASEIVVSRMGLKEASGAMGKVRGFLPQHWPEWFAPRAVDFPPRPFGPFPESLPLTEAGDVHLVPTPGHTAGHMSVVIEEGEVALFLAGDTSYTEELMLKGAVDGVAPDAPAAALSLKRIQDLARDRPTVYLPSHDPESGKRLAGRVAAYSGA